MPLVQQLNAPNTTSWRLATKPPFYQMYTQYAKIGPNKGLPVLRIGQMKKSNDASKLATQALQKMLFIDLTSQQARRLAIKAVLLMDLEITGTGIAMENLDRDDDEFVGSAGCPEFTGIKKYHSTWRNGKIEYFVGACTTATQSGVLTFLRGLNMEPKIFKQFVEVVGKECIPALECLEGSRLLEVGGGIRAIIVFATVDIAFRLAEMRGMNQPNEDIVAEIVTNLDADEEGQGWAAAAILLHLTSSSYYPDKTGALTPQQFRCAIASEQFVFNVGNEVDRRVKLKTARPKKNQMLPQLTQVVESLLPASPFNVPVTLTRQNAMVGDGDEQPSTSGTSTSKPNEVKIMSSGDEDEEVQNQQPSPKKRKRSATKKPASRAVVMSSSESEDEEPELKDV